MSDEDGFLTRWSKRKMEPEKSADESLPPLEGERPAGVEQAALSDPGAAPVPGVEDSEAASPVDHIDIEGLTYEDDFTVFLKDKVPAKVRRMALRKLWASNPLFAAIDGLDDYAEDFTDAALAVKVLQTAHVVGKGYVDDLDEPEDLDDGDVADGEDEEVAEDALPVEPDEHAVADAGPVEEPVSDNEPPAEAKERG